MKNLRKNSDEGKYSDDDDNTYYFTQEHEDAIIEYCRTDNQAKRNKLFVEYIGPVFQEMIDKIVNTYKFSDLSNIEKHKEECLIELTTKLDKFDPENGSKAYSYFTVVIRNWFYQKLNEENDKKKSRVDLEDMPWHVENYYFTTENEYIEEREKQERIELFKEDLESWDKGRRGRILGDIDNKVIKALQQLFDNPEALEVFSKRAIYFHIRQLTDLNTKQISRSIKKLTERYERFKRKYENGELDDGEL